MAFFKPYNGTVHAGLKRLEQVIWTLIYGGLLLVVLGFFMERTADGEGTILFWVGGTVAAVGVVLIYVRSRLTERETQ